MALHTISVSDNLFERLMRESKESRRPISEVVNEALDRSLPLSLNAEESLTPALKSELEAMNVLSDSALWALAGSSLAPSEKEALSTLNKAAGERQLDESEHSRQGQLLASYDAMLVRRAHAALLLQQRGFDVTDPAIFA